MTIFTIFSVWVIFLTVFHIFSKTGKALFLRFLFNHPCLLRASTKNHWCSTLISCSTTVTCTVGVPSGGTPAIHTRPDNLVPELKKALFLLLSTL